MTWTPHICNNVMRYYEIQDIRLRPYKPISRDKSRRFKSSLTSLSNSCTSSLYLSGFNISRACFSNHTFSVSLNCLNAHFTLSQLAKNPRWTRLDLNDWPLQVSISEKHNNNEWGRGVDFVILILHCILKCIHMGLRTLPPTPFSPYTHARTHTHTHTFGEDSPKDSGLNGQTERFVHWVFRFRRSWAPFVLKQLLVIYRTIALCTILCGGGLECNYGTTRRRCSGGGSKKTH